MKLGMIPMHERWVRVERIELRLVGRETPDVHMSVAGHVLECCSDDQGYYVRQSFEEARDVKTLREVFDYPRHAVARFWVEPVTKTVAESR